MATATRTFILVLKNDDIRKITLPSTWHVTYGNVVPFTDKMKGNGESRIALRVYADKLKKDLRAVFTDVKAFREEGTIAVMERRTETKKQTLKKDTPEGSKDVVVEARVTEWVNPDEEKYGKPSEEFLSLAHHPST